RLARARARGGRAGEGRRGGRDRGPGARHGRGGPRRRARGGGRERGGRRSATGMLLKRIIPCLDVDRGRVVKGVQYVDHVDAGDPVEVARLYDEQEADEITFLDITASHERRRILLDVVARTAETVFMPLTVGGGVRSLQDVRDLVTAGADKVSIMTAAVENPDLVGEAAVKIGSANLVVAIDAKAVGPGRWEVFTHGGRRPTGLDAVAWARRMAEAGAGEILLTSMDQDGTRSGYDLALVRAVADAVSVPVIASG